MNKITEIFKNISDEELRQGILEIKEDGESGIIRDGVVRKYTKMVCDTSGILDLFFTQNNLCVEAAFRWINKKV